jgi:hypothetical protein
MHATDNRCGQGKERLTPATGHGTVQRSDVFQSNAEQPIRERHRLTMLVEELLPD